MRSFNPGSIAERTRSARSAARESVTVAACSLAAAAGDSCCASTAARALLSASKTFGAEEGLRTGFLHQIAAPQTWPGLIERAAVDEPGPGLWRCDLVQ